MDQCADGKILTNHPVHHAQEQVDDMKTVRPNAKKATVLRPLSEKTKTTKVILNDSAEVMVFETGVGPVAIEVKFVQAGAARRHLPGLIRKSAQAGIGYLIHNARNPKAATALLIDPRVLQKRIEQARPSRTLAQVLERLPFRRPGGNSLLNVGPLPDDELPNLGILGMEHAPEPKDAAR